MRNRCFTNPGSIYIRKYYISSLFLSSDHSGVQGNDWKTTCVGEETQLTCDHLDPATKNLEYFELVWSVSDSENPLDGTYISYCGKNPNKCSTYPLRQSRFAQRIRVRISSHGRIYVTQLWENDKLSFSCQIFLRGNKRPLVTSVNLSSVSCLSLRIGQEINLSEASGENHISPETVYDKWWYIIQPNGGKTPIAYCNATLCSDILRPEFKTRMEINGMSLILKKAKLADKGLRLQCRILQNNKPLPLLYNVMVKNVSVNPTTESNTSKRDIPIKTTTGINTSITEWERITSTASCIYATILSFLSLFGSVFNGY